MFPHSAFTLGQRTRGNPLGTPQRVPTPRVTETVDTTGNRVLFDEESRSFTDDDGRMTVMTTSMAMPMSMPAPMATPMAMPTPQQASPAREDDVLSHHLV